MDYDLVIVGTGTAGTNAAFVCSSGGMRVAIADFRPYGGTCALRGCAPKKVLVGATSTLAHAKRMQGLGMFGPDLEFDWGSLIRFKRSFTDLIPEKRMHYYKRNGIDTYSGVATFRGPDSLYVGEEALSSRYFLVASGSVPRKLNIPGEGHLLTSEDFMELDKLPESIIFVGGGYISFEFSHVAASAGAEVKIIHKGPNPLPGFDGAVVKRLLDATKALGIEVILDSQVASIESNEKGVMVKSTKNREFLYSEADCAVHGAGRVPELDALALDNANVDHSSKGVIVNSFLQSTSNPNVYAAGDVVQGRPMLKALAEHEGIIAGNNILHGNKLEMDYSVTPSVLFTMPEMASVGLTEGQAKAEGLDYVVKEMDMSSWFSSRHIGMGNAYSKVIKDKAHDHILGAHLICPRAGDLINVFALAIKAKMPARELKEIPWAFPTNTSDLAYMV